MAKHRVKKPIKYYSPKRRAVYAQGDDIDPLLLFEMHAWTCYLCKKAINPRLRSPNFWAATVEHLVPLSKGGGHDWTNIVPAHAICNFKKGDSFPDAC